MAPSAQDPNLSESCIDSCLVGHALDGMCVGLVMTSAGGRVTWMNRSARRMIGMSGPECAGRPLAQVLKDPAFAAFWHEAQEAEHTQMGEVCVQWPQKADLKVNFSRCFNVMGESIGSALLFCDLTDEKAVQVSLSQQATARLMNIADNWEKAGDGEAHAGLTAQETRVLRLVGHGLGNREIAERMAVTISTVRSHLKHIYQKTSLKSRTEAVRYAVQRGLT